MTSIIQNESPKIFSSFKKEDLCVAQLFNGIIVLGEDKGDYIENPISIEYAPSESGIGAMCKCIGDPILSKKANALEGIPEIKKFILKPMAKSNCMICNNLSEIELGGQFLSMYADVMTKVANPNEKKSPIIQR